MTTPIYDALIIGGGPGGLTAAVYLRRFRRDIIVIDKGRSRLDLIPVTHNYPGCPDGVRGEQLLDNLRCQLQNYGGNVTPGEVTDLPREGDVFVAQYSHGETGGEIRARTVLLSTALLTLACRLKTGARQWPLGRSDCVPCATASMYLTRILPWCRQTPTRSGTRSSCALSAPM